MEQLNGQYHRQLWIQQKLAACGSVSVAELCKELGTSTVTIRKDLGMMEQQGQLIRIHGGAVPVNDVSKEDTLFGSVPMVKNLELKHRVAKAAAEYISDGDSLILTSGVTPHLTALYANACKHLKIVTDSFFITEDLCKRSDYQMVLLGGELHNRELFVYGRDAVRQAGRYMADKAVLTMDGVDAKAGLTTLRMEGADTLKSILERARQRIIVADITKIGVESFCNIGDIRFADILVTNSTTDPDKLECIHEIEAAGVTVKLA